MTSTNERLRKLDELRSSGLISDEEYAEKRGQILAEATAANASAGGSSDQGALRRGAGPQDGRGGGATWWQSTPAILISLVLVFPVGLFLMWRYAPWRMRSKWAWSAGWGVLLGLVVIAVAGGGGNSGSQTRNDSSAAVRGGIVSSTAAIETTTAVAPTETLTPTVAATATPDSEVDTELDTSGIAPATAAAPSNVVLPDPSLTPGDVFPVGVAQICVSGYSSSVRSVSTSTKNQVYAEYNIASHAPGQYEVDHLIPLELGGSNSIRNLWPEPADPVPGFHQKDLLENKLHAVVCAGSLDLATAQHAIATNWYAAYVQYELGGSAPPPPAATAPASAPPPPPPAPPSQGASVTFTSVVGAAPGGIASATVQTASGSSCSLSYTTPAGTHSTAAGLGPATADGNGVASWSWRIGGSTHPGTGSVTATCDGVSATAAIVIS